MCGRGCAKRGHERKRCVALFWQLYAPRRFFSWDLSLSSHGLPRHILRRNSMAPEGSFDLGGFLRLRGGLHTCNGGDVRTAEKCRVATTATTARLHCPTAAMSARRHVRSSRSRPRSNCRGS